MRLRRSGRAGRRRVAARCGAFVALGGAWLVACTPASYVASADREVGGVLGEARQRVLSERERWVLRPDTEREAEEEPVAEDGIRAASAPVAEGDVGEMGEVGEAEGDRRGTPDHATQAGLLEIGLAEALASAFSTGREHKNQLEGLYLAGLSLTGTRFTFGPRIDSGLAYRVTDAEDGRRRTTAGWDIGLSQILPTGGTVALGFGLDTARTEGPHAGDPEKGREWRSAFDVTLSQPLARGAGRAIAYEPLVQAERNLVYAIRSFELFRQQHAIAIARDYFQLVSRQTQIANNEESYRGAVFDRQKAEALRLVDRNTIEDVFRARRREVAEESDLLQAKANFAADLDAFRIRLGLPEGASLLIRSEVAPYQPVRIDAESAVRVALHNRLDLLTARERLEDTERGVLIARDGLRSSVDLGLGFSLTGAAGDDFDNAGPDVWAASAALTVDLPIQKTPERNAYRSALIELDRARRDLDLQLQNVERDVRDALRQLRRTELQIALQEQQIEQELRAVAVTEIRVESGDADNRDLLEARQALVDLQNQLVDQKVSHSIARLSLLRDLGILFIDEKGMWTP